jgi:hypothetical protein
MTAVFIALVLIICCTIALTALAVRANRRLQRHQNWLAAQLATIARDCSDFPQAAMVAISLQHVAGGNNPINITQLRRSLAAVERNHDAIVVEQSKHWSAIQARVAEERRAGEPLPGFEGGAS